jgi:hypothetical protein
MNAPTSFVNWIREHQSDVSLVLFLAAGLTGVLLHGRAIHPEGGWGGEMMHLANNLADHGAFANPYSSLDTGPTANNPPLYPFVVAGLFELLRDGTSVYFTTVLGRILANAITAVLLLRVAVLFYGDVIPGVIASILWLTVLPAEPGWDTSYTVMGLLFFALFTSSMAGDGDMVRRAALSGAFAGLLALLNPSSLLISLPWIVFVFWRSKTDFHRVVKCAAILLIVLGVFVGAWCMRNYRQLGAFALRTGFGVILRESNNDCAQPSQFRNRLNGCSQTFHPMSNLREAELLLRVGEVQYNQVQAADTKKWIAANPQKFLHLALTRLREFWFPAVEVVPTGPLPYFVHYDFAPDWVAHWVRQQNAIAYAMWIITALSIPGLILMARRGELGRVNTNQYFRVILFLWRSRKRSTVA